MPDCIIGKCIGITSLFACVCSLARGGCAFVLVQSGALVVASRNAPRGFARRVGSLALATMHQDAAPSPSSPSRRTSRSSTTSCAPATLLPDTIGAFTSLVDEYLEGYPTIGNRLLAPENVQYVAGKLLLLETQASPPQLQPDQFRMAACLFVLYVQEYLIHRQTVILGTDVAQLYALLQTLLHVPSPAEGGEVESDAATQQKDRQAAFIQGVVRVDMDGSAADLLRQPGVVDALWGDSSGLEALYPVDENMSTYSEDPAGGRLPEPIDHLELGVQVRTPGSARDGDRRWQLITHLPRRLGLWSTVRRTTRSSGGVASLGGVPEATGSNHNGSDYPGLAVLAAQPKQKLLSRRFVDPTLEARFRHQFFLMYGSWLRRCTYVFATALLIMAIFAALPTSQFWKFALISMGSDIAWPMLLCPLAWCVLVAVATSFERIYNPQTYLLFVALTAIGLVLCYSIPVWILGARPVVFLGEMTHNRTDLAVEIGFTPIPTNCTAGVYDHEILEATAVRTANHAIIAFCAYVATAVLSSDPLATLTLCVSMGAAFVLRSRVLWHRALCLDAVLTIPYHTLVTALAVLVSYTQVHVLRRQLLLRIEMQRIRDARIEQLCNEKERLDFERAFAVKRAMWSPLLGAAEGLDGLGHTPENTPPGACASIIRTAMQQQMLGQHDDELFTSGL